MPESPEPDAASPAPPFSRRFAGLDTTPSRLSAEAVRLRATGRHLVDLTVSNPTRAGLQYPDDAIRQCLAEALGGVYEPEALGLPSARESICEYYAHRGSIVDPDRVLITASTSEACSLLFKLLADPGDELLAPVPGYPLFDYLALAEGLKLLPYPIHYVDGWQLDLTALEAAVSSRTRALLLVHPNNPTGHYLSRHEWEGVQALAVRQGLALIVDEVFFDFPLDDGQQHLNVCGSSQALTFVLNGLSKTAGLPQLKLAWIVTQGPPETVRASLEKLEVISDTFLSVSTPVQRALADLLKLAPTIRAAIGRRVRDNRGLPAFSRLDLLPAQGGWSAIVRIPATQSGEEWALQLLSEFGVLTHPGELFGFSSPHLILSCLTPSLEMARGLHDIDCCLAG